MSEQLTLTGEHWPPPRQPGPIEAAWASGDDVATVEAVVAKCARMLDESKSCRDVKALAVTVLDGVDIRHRLRAGDVSDEEDDGKCSPLDSVIYRFSQSGRAAS